MLQSVQFITSPQLLLNWIEYVEQGQVGTQLPHVEYICEILVIFEFEEMFGPKTRIYIQKEKEVRRQE